MRATGLIDECWRDVFHAGFLHLHTMSSKRKQSCFIPLPCPSRQMLMHSSDNGNMWNKERDQSVAFNSSAPPKSKWTCRNSPQWLLRVAGCASMLAIPDR